MQEKPKTWLDSEIVELMTAECRAYRHHQQLMRQPVNYQEMMENVLHVLKDKGLIEDTP
jgi:hypothetical protein